MPIKLGVLKGIDEKLKKDGQSGSSLLFRQKDLPEEIIGRLAPSPAELNGAWCLELFRVWIDNKPVILWTTFGKKDYIAEEVEMAKEDGDEDTLALINDKERLKFERIYWTGMFFMEEKKGKLVVIDDMCKVFEFGRMLYKRTNKVAMSRVCQNGTEEGIGDRELGYNMQLSKTGTKLKTEYDAQLAEQYEMPARLYRNIPNVYEFAKLSTPSSKYQRALIREFLYGEPISKSLEAQEEERKELIKAWFKEHTPDNSSVTSKSTKKKSRDDDDDDDEEEDERPRKKTVTKKRRDEEDEDDDEDDHPRRNKKRSVREEEDDDDDEEEDEKPKRRPKQPVTKRSAKDWHEDDDDEEEDDDDDEEEDEKPKKKAASKKSAPKKKATAPKKKSRDDDDDDDEEEDEEEEDEDDDEDYEEDIDVALAKGGKKAASKKSAAPKKKAKKEEDDDDEEDWDDDDEDDDDEEEAKPTKKKVAGRLRKALR